MLFWVGKDTRSKNDDQSEDNADDDEEEEDAHTREKEVTERESHFMFIF